MPEQFRANRVEIVAIWLCVAQSASGNSHAITNVFAGHSEIPEFEAPGCSTNLFPYLRTDGELVDYPVDTLDLFAYGQSPRMCCLVRDGAAQRHDVILDVYLDVAPLECNFSRQVALDPRRDPGVGDHLARLAHRVA